MRVCPKCGGRLTTGTREIAHDVAGRRFLLTLSARKCASCSTSYLDAASAEEGDLQVACWLALHGPAVGAALRPMRKALGARAIDVAELLDVTAETVSRWETGRRPLDRGAWIVLGSLLLEKAGIAPRTQERLQMFSANPPRGRPIKLDARHPGRLPSSSASISGVVEKPRSARRSGRR